MDIRKKMWNELLKNVSWASKLLFKDLMEKRGYRGEILLNHKAQTLDLKVSTTAKELEDSEEDSSDEEAPIKKKGGRAANTLSGGMQLIA